MDTKTNSKTPTSITRTLECSRDGNTRIRIQGEGLPFPGVYFAAEGNPNAEYPAGPRYLAAYNAVEALLNERASQSARIAELTEALAALVEHAGRIPNQRTMTTEFMAAYSLARAALKDSK